MFGFGKKKTPIERMREALDRNDDASVVKTARDAFEDPESTEDTLAWTAAVMYERKIVAGMDLLLAFVERFPHSIHLPRVYLADLHARSSRFDVATDEARVYLRCASDRGVFQVLREGIVR